jgi:TonB family protein
MTDAATFYPRDPMRGSFIAALTLHLGIIGTIAVSAWLHGHSQPFGSPDAGGGAIAIETVSTIPIPKHHGETNPLASDTESDVPQTPTKPVDRVKEEIAKPNAIPLKAKKEKLKKAEAESQHQRFRPYDELATNQLTSNTPQQVSNKMYTAQTGAGSISPGAHTTLGVRLSWYAGQIQDIVARHWRTSDIDQRLQTAPPVIATFELMRDGSIRNVQILQGSNISALDISVKRAILDSAPFPPIPPNQGFDKDYAKVEFTFELKQ